MLCWLTIFSDGGDFWNLFRYITFRAGGAFFTSLVFGFFFGRQGLIGDGCQLFLNPPGGWRNIVLITTN